MRRKKPGRKTIENVGSMFCDTDDVALVCWSAKNVALRIVLNDGVASNDHSLPGRSLMVRAAKLSRALWAFDVHHWKRAFTDLWTSVKVK